VVPARDGARFQVAGNLAHHSLERIQACCRDPGGKQRGPSRVGAPEKLLYAGSEAVATSPPRPELTSESGGKEWESTVSSTSPAPCARAAVCAPDRSRSFRAARRSGRGSAGGNEARSPPSPTTAVFFLGCTLPPRGMMGLDARLPDWGRRPHEIGGTSRHFFSSGFHVVAGALEIRIQPLPQGAKRHWQCAPPTYYAANRNTLTSTV
jgi:hypothetical protein